jgi:methionyl-tRNA formyltransferase
VVVAYGRILPESFLNAFPKGAINVHFSLLPKYRGAAPVNWAIVNGETRTGVTTMRMDAGLDTGDILLQREIEIRPEETSPDLMERMSLIGADLLSETLSRLGEISQQPQDHEKATFAPIMKREDGLIDWSLTAPEIVNRVRGFQPFPGSFTSYMGQKLTVWKATAISNLDSEVKRSGEIIKAHGDELVVSSGKGTALSIEELQLEGKRRMTTRDVLNGISMKVGELIGRQ